MMYYIAGRSLGGERRRFAVSRTTVRVCMPLEKLVLRPSPCYKTVYHIISVVSATMRGG